MRYVDLVANQPVPGGVRSLRPFLMEAQALAILSKVYVLDLFYQSFDIFAEPPSHDLCCAGLCKDFQDNLFLHVIFFMTFLFHLVCFFPEGFVALLCACVLSHFHHSLTQEISQTEPCPNPLNDIRFLCDGRESPWGILQ